MKRLGENMKRNTKIILGITILIPIIAIIGGIIWFETTTVSVDELKQERTTNNEVVVNETNNTTSKQKDIDEEYESNLEYLKGSKDRASNIVNNY